MGTRWSHTEFYRGTSAPSHPAHHEPFPDEQGEDWQKARPGWGQLAAVCWKLDRGEETTRCSGLESRPTGRSGNSRLAMLSASPEHCQRRQTGREESQSLPYQFSLLSYYARKVTPDIKQPLLKDLARHRRIKDHRPELVELHILEACTLPEGPDPVGSIRPLKCAYSWWR